MHEPLPLQPGEHVQPPFRLTLEPDGDRGWTLIHDPAGGFRSMRWMTDLASAGDFVTKHEWLSTAPDSGFVQVPMAERRDATGVDVIRTVTLSRIGNGAFTAEPIVRESEWFEVLADVFDLNFDGHPPEWRHSLWDTVFARHRDWQASRT
ncbi:arylamine N-acetyltransferase [Nocardioides ungokensis]|uniref:arylamine N-acetyltransferase n=1 Tax=Nocardioides ungokensis TaxID=1643322 RepID=UPI003CCD1268